MFVGECYSVPGISFSLTLGDIKLLVYIFIGLLIPNALVVPGLYEL